MPTELPTLLSLHKRLGQVLEYVGPWGNDSLANSLSFLLWIHRWHCIYFRYCPSLPVPTQPIPYFHDFERADWRWMRTRPNPWPFAPTHRCYATVALRLRTCNNWNTWARTSATMGRWQMPLTRWHTIFLVHRICSELGIKNRNHAMLWIF